MNAHELQAEFVRLRHRGVQLAGALSDISQRAAVYQQLYVDSGRNHVFPLIAAHGALWARGYFRFGMQLARWLSWQYALSPTLRRDQLQSLAVFLDALRDINRRVCADTYASYHFVGRYRRQAAVAEIVSPEFFEALCRVHAAREANRELSDAEKRQVFELHFRNEQETVVGATLTAAVPELQWPLIRRFALRPVISFAYFPRGQRLSFANFADREERIANGVKAFSLAARVGWPATEAALARYSASSCEPFRIQAPGSATSVNVPPQLYPRHCDALACNGGVARRPEGRVSESPPSFLRSWIHRKAVP
jgi:hypothetical protein